MARRIARDNELARDALQVSWLKILQATNFSLGGPTACPWVAKVVANSIRDLQRQERRRREVPLEGVEHLKAEQSLESEAQKQQMLELLREMVAMLPDTYRRVYELRMQEELSTREVADQLGLSYSNVTTVLSRAVKMIERKLQNRLRHGAMKEASGGTQENL